jgi:hypothetical protein
MSEHPIACYRGLDSSGAVRFGALMTPTLDEPFVVASAYVSDPVGSMLPGIHSPAAGGAVVADARAPRGS